MHTQHCRRISQVERVKATAIFDAACVKLGAQCTVGQQRAPVQFFLQVY